MVHYRVPRVRPFKLSLNAASQTGNVRASPSMVKHIGESVIVIVRMPAFRIAEERNLHGETVG